MSNLANKYLDLGRHEDALKLLEEILEFRQRILPADHPDIRSIMDDMDDISSEYLKLGRQEDAVKLRKKLLRFESACCQRITLISAYACMISQIYIQISVGKKTHFRYLRRVLRFANTHLQMITQLFH